MSIDTLPVWQSTFVALPQVLDNSWPATFSAWVNDRVTAKAQVTGVTHATPPFTFSQATFQTQLSALANTSDKTAGATAFAAAWRSAIDSSVLSTLPNDFVNPGGAPNLIWSVINSSVIDVSSRNTAESQMITDIVNASDVIDPNSSLLPQIIRDAFLALTCSIIGLDQTIPVPQALSILGSPLI